MSQPPPYYPPPPPHYGSPYGPGPYRYPPPPPTNGMAIASLICAFVFAPLGIVFGHISLSQIKKTGEEGRGLAIAGLVISYLVTVLSILVVVAGIVFFSWMARELERNGGAGIPGRTIAGGSGELPPFAPPASLGTNCQYPATATPADKPVTPPPAGNVPTTPATVDATMITNAGPIVLHLDNAKAPCTVNSFESLIKQNYFDNTPCHRLTDSPSLSVLQCGDPTGQGTGGPGYRFANEYPTNQYRPFDQALRQPVRYPRGTLAMANAGPDTNGSQFFIVYRDSMLPPTYTAFGQVDKTAFGIVQDMASVGIAGGADDGKPARPVTIKSIRLN